MLQVIYLKHFNFQLVAVMLPVPAVCNALIQVDNVPVMRAIKEPNVILLVVVIPLVQVAQHVISQQVNVLAIQGTQEPHVTLVLPITTEQVVELVQVSIQLISRRNHL